MRAAEWWSYKIPPLLAIAYAFILIGDRPPVESIPQAVAGIVSIIAVAAYGYVINDCFDIEVDRRAGKRNSMAGRSVMQRAGILAVILSVGWLPAVVVGYGGLSCLLLAINFLLPTIYSIPPIRLKERGVSGILSDAFAAHLVPTLFLASLLVLPLPTVGLYRWLVVGVMAAWYLCVGLRGIMTHQILDREADLASGVVTLATTQDAIRLLRWDRRILYVVEMGVFVSLILLLGQRNVLLVVVFGVFLVLESLMRVMKWGYFVEKSPHEGKRFYLPFANNLFYSLWMPLVLAVELAIRWPILFALPIVHFLLFSRGRGREHREPIEVLRDTFHEIRRYFARRRFGWQVVVDRSHWPVMRLSDETYPSLQVTSKKRLAHPWDLRLHSERYPLEKGESYQLQVFLRASSPRVVTVGVCQRHSPWRDLGFVDVIPLTTKWEHFIFDLTASQTEANGGIFLWLGGHEASVEIGEARLIRVTDPAPWRLVLTRPAQAWRSPPNDSEYLVRIDRMKTDGVAWHIKLTARPFRVRKGECYRVSVSLRSEQSRRVTFGISQAYAPFDVAGLCEEVMIQEMFEDFQADFVAERDEEVNFFAWLGAADAIVEILSVQCRPIATERFWHLDRAEGCLAWRVTTDDPDRVIVQVPDAYPAADSINLWTPIDLGTTKEWGCRFRLRTLRSSGPIRGGIAERVGDDWRAIHLFELADLSKATSRELLFSSHRPELPHRFFLWIADLDDMLLLDDFELFANPEGGVWQIQSEAGTTGEMVRQAGGVMRVEPHGSVGPDYSLRVVGLANIESSRHWRASISMRADQVRLATISAEREEIESTGVDRSRGLSAEVTLSPEWKEFTLDLPEQMAGERAHWNWSLRFGASLVPVEWRQGKYHEIDASESWFLEADKGVQAQFVRATTASASGRLEILESGNEPTALKMFQSIGMTRLPALSRFEVTLRSDRARSVLIGLGEESPPWRSIVEPVKVSLDSSWRTHLLFVDPKVIAEGGFSSARLFVWLGGEAVGVEWKGSGQHVLGKGERPFRLATSGSARLQWELAAERSHLRVVPVEPGMKPFDAQAVAELGPVAEGELYRLVVEIRSDQSRPVTIAVSESSSPWDAIGLVRSVTTSTTLKAWLFDFRAKKNDGAARLTLALGGDGAGIEIGRVSFLPVEPKRSPAIRSASEKVVCLAVPEDPGAVRYVPAVTSDPWEIKLTTEPTGLTAGVAYELAVRLRSDVDRSVLVGVGQSGPPWSMELSPTKIEVGPAWRHFQFHFQASNDEPMAEGLLLLGGSDVAVDVSEMTLSPAAGVPFWQLEAFDGRAFRLKSAEDWSGESFAVVRSSGEAWRVKITAPPMDVEAGSTHHLSIRLRADHPRTVSVGLAQGREPWDGLGLFERIDIGPEEVVWSTSWLADRSEERGIFFVWMGDQVGQVDVADFRWAVDPPPPTPEEPTPAALLQEDVGGNGEVDAQSNDIDHAGDEGSAAVSGIDSHAEEEQREQGTE
jgi:4-hydroxybenzoate polyprenyltransferase